METTDYAKQATDFLTETGATLTLLYLHHGKHFEDDKDTRNVWQFTLKRRGAHYTGTFGDSIRDSWHHSHYTSPYKKHPGKSCVWGKDCDHRSATQTKKNTPTAYDILTAITKHDPDTFENFCMEFGYETDSRKALETFLACGKEWDGVRRVFGDVLERLQGIQ